MAENNNSFFAGCCDTVSTEDYLGCEQYYQAISRFLTTCMTPMTMSLQGGWGSGKSTAIQLIEDTIVNKMKIENCYIIKFNTWQYSKYGVDGNLMEALLTHLVRKVKELSEQCGKDASAIEAIFWQIKQYVKTGVQVAGHIGLKAAENASGFDAKNIGEAAKCLLGSSDVTDLEFMKKKLSEQIEKFVGEENGRLLIFVDDLDRLEPAQAIELLEGLKVFLDLEKCVFVLAMDQDVVYQGIESKYGDSFDEKKKKNFFDKIIQVPFDLPVQQYDISKYIEHLLTQSQPDVVISKEVRQKYADAVTYLSDWEEPNPRAIKRLYNLLALYQIMLSDKLPLTDENQFYIFIYLLYKSRGNHGEDAKELLDHAVNTDQLYQFLKQDDNRMYALGLDAQEESCDVTQLNDFLNVLEQIRSISNTNELMACSALMERLEKDYGLECRKEAGKDGKTRSVFYKGNVKIISVTNHEETSGNYNVVLHKVDPAVFDGIKTELNEKYKYSGYHHTGGKSFATFVQPFERITVEYIFRRYLDTL